MMSPDPRPTSLRSQIEAAFSTAMYPGDDNLVVDRRPSHLECSEIASTFRGKRWQEVPLDVLRYNHQSLAFFTPEAFTYFLPAYLLASLDAYEEAGDIPSSLLFHLTPPPVDDPRDEDRFRSIMDTLSASQRRSIRAFVETMRDEHGEDDDWEQTFQQFWARVG